MPEGASPRRKRNVLFLFPFRAEGFQLSFQWIRGNECAHGSSP